MEQELEVSRPTPALQLDFPEAEEPYSLNESLEYVSLLHKKRKLTKELVSSRH